MEIEKNAQNIAVTIIRRVQTIIYLSPPVSQKEFFFHEKIFFLIFKRKRNKHIFHQNKILKNTLRPKASKSHHMFFPGFILKPCIAIQKNGVKKQKIPEKKSPPTMSKQNIIKYHSKTPKFLTDTAKKSTLY